MTANDEPTADALRRLAAAHAPDDSWQPDATAVLRRGRVLRFRRRTSTATAGAVVLALAIGVPAMLAGHGATGPVNPGQPTSTSLPTSSPTASADGTLGPTEVNTYGQQTYAVGAGQAAVLDVPNLYAVNVPQASESELVAHGVGGVDVTVKEDSPGTARITLDARANHGRMVTVDLTWLLDEQASSYSMSSHYPIPEIVTASNDVFQFSYLVGTVPSWMPDPVVQLVSDTPWTLPDGTTTHWAQVPTFRAPTPDGRLMFVITGAGNMALNWLAAGHHVAIAFSSSSGPFVPGCEQDIGAYGCDLIPMPAQYLTGEPALFSPLADQPAPTGGATPGSLNTSSSSTTSWPDVAPAPVEIAPGVLAATGASKSTISNPLDVGAGDWVSVGTFGGWEANISRGGADRDAMVYMGLSRGGSDCGQQPVAKQMLGPWATVEYTVGDCIGPAAWSVFGTTPPDMASPRVFFVAPAGIPLADGTTGRLLQVPTFTMPPWANNPINADRPWFALVLSSAVVDSIRQGSPSSGMYFGDIVFAGPDGSIEDDRCGHSLCTDAASQAVYTTIRQIVAKEVGPGN